VKRRTSRFRGNAAATLWPLAVLVQSVQHGGASRPGTGCLRHAIVGGQDITGLSLVLPCTEDPELFFAESPQDVEQAKAMCRGCRARLACLAGALERREPWGVWGGELLMSGAIVPHKRSRGRPRKDVVTIGANA
jgi:WhiB family redox-sensing transcriptional regulator